MLTAEASSDEARRGTRQTLVRTLEALLRLSHPLMPFISEEIWRRVAPLAGKHGDTIMLQPYPEPDAEQVDEQAIAEMGWLMKFVLGVRRIRGEMDIAPGKPLPVLLQNGSETDRSYLDKLHSNLERLARLEEITWLAPGEHAPECAAALVGEMKILIPMAGLIDKQAELSRLSREIEKLQKDLTRSEGKLANPNFVGKAPPAVVHKERNRVTEMQSAISRLREQRTRIEAL